MQEWNEGEVRHKDFVRGAVDPKDFEDTPYRKSKHPKHCPKNNKGPHVYETERVVTTTMYRSGNQIIWSVMTCNFCGKHGKSTYTVRKPND